MRTIGAVVALALLVSVMLPEIRTAEAGSAAAGTREADECVRCHTNVKGLIRLGWEVEKLRPQAEKSSETAGEG